MPAHEDARLLPRGAERSTEASSAASAAAPAAAPTASQRRAALRIQRRVRAYLDGKRLQRRMCVAFPLFRGPATRITLATLAVGAACGAPRAHRRARCARQPRANTGAALRRR